MSGLGSYESLCQMRKLNKGDCTLETMSMEEFCIKGACFNWCIFLLNALMDAWKKTHITRYPVIYGYILLAFAMCQVENF